MISRGGTWLDGWRCKRLRAARVAPVLLVAPAAGRLEEPGSGEADREATQSHGPRPATAKIFEVGEDPIRIGLLEIAAHPLDASGRLLGRLRGLVLPLLAQLVGDAADVLCRRSHPLAGLGRALVDLLSQAILGAPTCLARLLLDLLGRLLGLLLRTAGGRGGF